MGSKACSAGHRYAKCDEEFEAVEEKNCEGLSPDPEIPNTNIDGLVKSLKRRFSVIPVKTGI
jgi:hypothetical protein